MTPIVRSKEKTEVLLVFGLLFLTSEFITEAFPLSTNSIPDEIVQQQNIQIVVDNKTPICYEEKQNEIDLVLIPIPEIIAQLGLLTGASMKQPLDSAFDWPKNLIRTNETTKRDELGIKLSPIIKNPKSFKKTLQQIKQQFTSVLNTINTNSEQMFAIMKEARTIWKAAIKWFYDTHNLNDYLTHSQELNTFVLLFSKQLTDLKEESDKMVLLSGQNSVELQWMTNLTEALTEAVYATHEAKLEYTNGTLKKEIETQTNRKNKLEKEIRALKEEHQQLNYKVTKSEDKFYQKVQRFLHAVGRKHQRNSKARKCLENLAIKNWNVTGDFYVMCRAKSSRLERKNLRTAKIANFIWKTFLQALNDVSNNLGKNEEEHGKLILVVQLLEQTKNELEQDILFLDSTTELVDKLEKKMEELTFDGWEKLASLCLEIQSAISIIKGRVLSYNVLVNLKRDIPSEKSLQEMNQQLLKTEMKMSLVGNAVKAYVITYESELSSLMNQLEEITKADNKNLTELEEQLINACKKASSEIEGFLAVMNRGISSISNSAYSL